ncbi:hypothetical protein A3Q56_05326 [Intoshia linei]|uniref:Uncharacterized protein n=1 Tax=Intoshia linei TaxID=1819745 RepID=A0A177AZZ1_9BILA|nr:hypothetical protein A3Q56_05326 [Intoshia linei]
MNKITILTCQLFKKNIFRLNHKLTYYTEKLNKPYKNEEYAIFDQLLRESSQFRIGDNSGKVYSAKVVDFTNDTAFLDYGLKFLVAVPFESIYDRKNKKIHTNVKIYVQEAEMTQLNVGHKRAITLKESKGHIVGFD